MLSVPFSCIAIGGQSKRSLYQAGEHGQSDFPASVRSTDEGYVRLKISNEPPNMRHAWSVVGKETLWMVSSSHLQVRDSSMSSITRHPKTQEVDDMKKGTNGKLAAAFAVCFVALVVVCLSSASTAQLRDGRRSPRQGGAVKPEIEDTMRLDVYADNRFSLYINGNFVAVDSIRFMPHNVISVEVFPEYPMTIAVMAKDNADAKTALEYNNPQIGDGGFILELADGTVTGKHWKAKSVFHGPIDGDTPKKSPILDSAGA